MCSTVPLPRWVLVCRWTRASQRVGSRGGGVYAGRVRVVAGRARLCGWRRGDGGWMCGLPPRGNWAKSVRFAKFDKLERICYSSCVNLKSASTKVLALLRVWIARNDPPGRFRESEATLQFCQGIPPVFRGSPSLMWGWWIVGLIEGPESNLQTGGLKPCQRWHGGRNVFFEQERCVRP